MTRLLFAAPRHGGKSVMEAKRPVRSCRRGVSGSFGRAQPARTSPRPPVAVVVVVTAREHGFTSDKVMRRTRSVKCEKLDEGPSMKEGRPSFTAMFVACARGFADLDPVARR